MNKELLKKIENAGKDNVRICKDKFGVSVVLINESGINSDQPYETIKFYNEDSGKDIGYLNYNVKFTDGPHIWIYKVAVYDAADLGRGVGSYAFKFLDEKAYSRRICTIEGKYYPEAPATGEQVKKFYERNGYDITHEDYDLMVSKYVTKESIESIKHNTHIDKSGNLCYGALKDMAPGCELVKK